MGIGLGPAEGAAGAPAASPNLITTRYSLLGRLLMPARARLGSVRFEPVTFGLSVVLRTVISGHPILGGSPRSCTWNPTTPGTPPPARYRPVAPHVRAVPASRPSSGSRCRRIPRYVSPLSRSSPG